jgi:hypothetical protein
VLSNGAYPVVSCFPGSFQVVSIICYLDIEEKPARMAFTFRDLRKMGWTRVHEKISATTHFDRYFSHAAEPIRVEADPRAILDSD